MNKTVTLLFTGGLDSTYILWSNLEAGHNVRCLYTKISNNESKTPHEYENVERLIEMFSRDYPKCNINLHVNEINVVFRGNISLVQAVIHIFSANISANNIKEEIQIGYCIGDDAVSFIDDIRKIHEGYSGFRIAESELTFPLLKLSKEEMIKTLPQKYLEQVFSCENPIGGEACGKCEVCEKYMFLHRRLNYRSLYRLVPKNIVLTTHVLDEAESIKSEKSMKAVSIEREYRANFPNTKLPDLELDAKELDTNSTYVPDHMKRDDGPMEKEIDSYCKSIEKEADNSKEEWSDTIYVKENEESISQNHMIKMDRCGKAPHPESQ